MDFIKQAIGHLQIRTFEVFRRPYEIPAFFIFRITPSNVHVKAFAEQMSPCFTSLQTVISVGSSNRVVSVGDPVSESVIFRIYIWSIPWFNMRASQKLSWNQQKVDVEEFYILHIV